MRGPGGALSTARCPASRRIPLQTSPVFRAAIKTRKSLLKAEEIANGWIDSTAISKQLTLIRIANLYGYLFSRLQRTQHNLAITLGEGGVTVNAFDVTLKLECQSLDKVFRRDRQTNLSCSLGRGDRPMQAITGPPEAGKANRVGCNDPWWQLVEEVFLGF